MESESVCPFRLHVRPLEWVSWGLVPQSRPLRAYCRFAKTFHPLPLVNKFALIVVHGPEQKRHVLRVQARNYLIQSRLCFFVRNYMIFVAVYCTPIRNFIVIEGWPILQSDSLPPKIKSRSHRMGLVSIIQNTACLGERDLMRTLQKRRCRVGEMKSRSSISYLSRQSAT